jgi:aspartate 1-decarboxylase
MRRNVFKSKIHRATVTQADLNYEGSVTIDEALMVAADIESFEAVHIWNVTRGTRLVTYAIGGAFGSGTICINGAAAHLNQPGDVVILATFAEMDDAEVRAHVPTVVFVDGRNQITERHARELPGPARRASGRARTPPPPPRVRPG